MIVHVVLLEPREDLDASKRERILADLTRAATEIPSIQRFRIGRRIQHGLPGYEQAIRDGYSYILLIEFENQEGLTTYLQHPVHDGIGAHFTSSTQRALAFDYELVDAHNVPAGYLVSDSR